MVLSGPKGFAPYHVLQKDVVRNCPSCLCSENGSFRTASGLAGFSSGCKPLVIAAPQ